MPRHPSPLLKQWGSWILKVEEPRGATQVLEEILMKMNLTLGGRGENGGYESINLHLTFFFCDEAVFLLFSSPGTQLPLACRCVEQRHRELSRPRLLHGEGSCMHRFLGRTWGRGRRLGGLFCSLAGGWTSESFDLLSSFREYTTRMSQRRGTLKPFPKNQ